MRLSPADRPAVCISQARMGSTRLPGKVMLPVLGRPLLAWHVSRLLRAREVDRVVVATTTEAQDDVIVDLCQSLGVAAFRGSESDVLSRYAGAATASGAATVLRVTSDCPLIDPDLIDRVVISFAEKRPSIDYLTLEAEDFPRGLDVEVFARGALEEADKLATEPQEREHVTPYIYRRPRRFQCERLGGERRLGWHRWCVDERRDFALVTHLIEALAPITPAFTWQDCLAVLERHPEWVELNRTVAQKTLSP